MPEESVGATDYQSCTCPTCRRKAGDAAAVRSAAVHEYSYTPRGGWTARRTGAETRDGITAPTFGVELETVLDEWRPRDLSGRPDVGYVSYYATDEERAEVARQRDAYEAWARRNRAHHERQREAHGEVLTAEEAAGLARPRGVWSPCHDGSVSGPEFKSQPATIAYWRHIRPHLADMFKALLHGGIRSHDGDRAGLHINIGDDSFDGAEHLRRFADLVYANPRWSTRVSQRTHDSVSHWCRFNMTDPADRQRWAEQKMTYGSARGERYDVLNGANAGRVEFRLPRGTLRLDRFYAKLEWAASMVEYTRDAARPTNVPSYIAWATSSGDYPELTAMLRERFPARFTDGAASAAPWTEPAPRVEAPVVPATASTTPVDASESTDADVVSEWLRDLPEYPAGGEPVCADVEPRRHAEASGRPYGWNCTRDREHRGHHAATDVRPRVWWSASLADRLADTLVNGRPLCVAEMASGDPCGRAWDDNAHAIFGGSIVFHGYQEPRLAVSA